MVETLAFQGANHTLAHRVGLWSLSWCFNRFDAKIRDGFVKGIFEKCSHGHGVRIGIGDPMEWLRESAGVPNLPLDSK